jgi:hypothetical protein
MLMQLQSAVTTRHTYQYLFFQINMVKIHPELAQGTVR